MKFFRGFKDVINMRDFNSIGELSEKVPDIIDNCLSEDELKRLVPV